jgi:prepilin-type N-terminal cleavage/methylation domain-containing protein
MLMRFKKQTASGFTVVELAIVIVVISIRRQLQLIAYIATNGTYLLVTSTWH